MKTNLKTLYFALDSRISPSDGISNIYKALEAFEKELKEMLHELHNVPSPKEDLIKEILGE